MKKLKAFTLLELVIGMIVGSVVMGICYMGYCSIYKQYLSYNATKKEIQLTMQFCSVFNTDLSCSQRCSSVDEKLVLTCYDGQTIQYLITDQIIVRTKIQISDTFNFPEINNIDKKYLLGDEDSQENLVSGFSFDSKILGEIEHFQFIKDYSADALVKLPEKNSDGDTDQ